VEILTVIFPFTGSDLKLLPVFPDETFDHGYFGVTLNIAAEDHICSGKSFSGYYPESVISSKPGYRRLRIAGQVCRTVAKHRTQ
jgi:hypothetical protein